MKNSVNGHNVIVVRAIELRQISKYFSIGVEDGKLILLQWKSETASESLEICFSVIHYPHTLISMNTFFEMRTRAHVFRNEFDANDDIHHHASIKNPETYQNLEKLILFKYEFQRVKIPLRKDKICGKFGPKVQLCLCFLQKLSFAWSARNIQFLDATYISQLGATFSMFP